MTRPTILRGALVVLAVAGLAACSPKLPDGVDDTVLAQSIGRQIGSASTCVVIADAANGRMVWRGGGYITCARNLPTCDGVVTTAEKLLQDNLGKPARFFSCDSGTAPGATVGWAIGPVPTGEGKPARNLTYVAVMEGDRALPGLEIKDRVEQAFKKAGF
ncbi:hypothetical protein OVA11_14970 [Caulobacter sp. SL161]|uniref:hypothetical protein n=1 Tax=Caulobacter sp. SL161 TaxID=2995156 RepID=UPI00227458AB|nr:hypothetical protein [Caulobacter sp. SL161]MCY1648317.1 hypothetical protein [Caulobacter sp. SL161]